MAGDWRLYLEALSEPGARVAYEAEPLNLHRRHENSVTHSLDGALHVGEIARVHAFARQVYAMTTPGEATQASYLQEVAVQLGVATESTEPVPAPGEQAPDEPAPVTPTVRRRARPRIVSSKRE
jgi:hypothetical protein